MWETGGVAYVYLIYGKWHQFAAVVNGADVPDVVFIRGVVPVEGIELMTAQWDKPRPVNQLADSPGKLCRSFQITKSLYGADLSGDELFLEDWDLAVDPEATRTAARVGISPRYAGHEAPLRYYVPQTSTVYLENGSPVPTA